ncbi:divalent-cation tolerance protein CutA [Methylomonas sp. LW13]|uniref:Divalent-cation tolerance protein CutA n=1 Tax=Methylomonas defluvii TaxID=3045149 RepID=A0ABU4UIM0_9GAMM|nr:MULTISPECIES: divalent-cation tolerance protein CutA [unclassified Methylomonas]MDX8129320.1 divalent-cation tolerance protein CutA [Methylomonas sp. OY6]QBC26747.1 divalent-cation tolerance protein CutA [Methylomonas sp. LW13]
MYQLILCTCPDLEVADKLAGTLITQKLAACVNILPGVCSVYEWQGEIETAQEHLLLIKSHQDRYAAIEATLKSLHPYQLPEIIAVAIASGSLDYLKWIDSCLGID